MKIFISCESKKNIPRICQRHLRIFQEYAEGILEYSKNMPKESKHIPFRCHKNEGVTVGHGKGIWHKNLPKEYS